MRTLTHLCLLVIILIGSQVAQACVNDGGKLREKPSKAITRVEALQTALETTPAEQLAALKTDWEKTADGNVAQQKAVELILSGQNRAAIEYLRKLEESQPGAYETAANLGTALELNGEPEEAWWWINEGIRRNPGSHQHSEWVHLKILEAKIALKSDPNWLAEHSVVETHMKGIRSGLYIMDGEEAEGPLIRLALYYQLKERLLFVKTYDPVVADLLKLLATLEDDMGQPENAIPVMELGQKFGLPPEFVSGKIVLFRSRESMIRNAKLMNYLPIPIVIAAAALLVAWITAIFGNPFRKKKPPTQTPI